MRVNEKGQVTLPRELLERVGIGPGEEVEFGQDGNVITLRKVEPAPAREPSRGERLAAALRGKGTLNRDLSTDEIMKLLRGDD